MSISGDTAEQTMKMCLDGTEYTLKIVGAMLEHTIALLLATAKETSKSSGKTSISKILKSGKEGKIFTLKKEDMKVFAEEAKNYKVLYSAIVSKRNNDIDNNIDIIVRAEDAPKVNRIAERFHLNMLDKANIIKESEREIEQKNPEEQELQVPLKENLSKNSLEKIDLDKSSNKTSVRKELAKIKNEMKVNVARKRKSKDREINL